MYCHVLPCTAMSGDILEAAESEKDVGILIRNTLKNFLFSIPLVVATLFNRIRMVSLISSHVGPSRVHAVPCS